MSLSKNPAMLAALALGGLWILGQQKARGGSAVGSVLGNPRYGTNAAVTGAPTQRYFVPPSGVLPAGQVAGVVNSALGFLSGLVGRSPALPASGGPAVVPAVNPYGFDRVQTGSVGYDTMTDAYSFGGPSAGVYGVAPGSVLRTESAPWGDGVVHGPGASYYGTITNPETFTGDPYNDGAGVDATVGSPAPNWDITYPDDGYMGR